MATRGADSKTGYVTNYFWRVEVEWGLARKPKLAYNVYKRKNPAGFYHLYDNPAGSVYVF